MDKANRKRKKQLRMPFGTACARLRKTVMFRLTQEAHRDICFRCGKRIRTVDEFSVDHRHPWLDSKDPVSTFFSLDNIVFSHPFCNSSVARKPLQKYFTEEARKAAKRVATARWMRKKYTTARRREKYKATGW